MIYLKLLITLIVFIFSVKAQSSTECINCIIANYCSFFDLNVNLFQYTPGQTGPWAISTNVISNCNYLISGSAVNTSSYKGITSAIYTYDATNCAGKPTFLWDMTNSLLESIFFPSNVTLLPTDTNIISQLYTGIPSGASVQYDPNHILTNYSIQGQGNYLFICYSNCNSPVTSMADNLKTFSYQQCYAPTTVSSYLPSPSSLASKNNIMIQYIIIIFIIYITILI